jgi:hypothetical protein
MNFPLTWTRVALAAATCAAAASASEQSPVDVHVLPDGENCSVYGQQMRCDSIGSYLRDARGVPFDRPIFLMIEGTQDSEARGRRVAELIARTGYSKLVRVGFITEPGKRPQRK